MDLNLYNIQYLEGLFGEPQSVHYTANMEKELTPAVLQFYLIPAFRQLQ